jgi:hypothetical protein
LRGILLALLLAGCNGMLPPLDSQDLASEADGGGDMELVDASGLPFGAACTMDADCATGHCFIGGARSFCTMPCTQATAATDCPSPPTSGMCNMRGFCKP